jgi:hypothetical protein
MNSLCRLPGYVVIVGGMSKQPILLTVVLLLALLAGACNFPGSSNRAAQTQISSVSPSPLGSDSEQISLDPDCTSALIPGRWIGNVSTSTTASSMGFRIINQTASIALDFDISCAGEVTGSASRDGSGEIRVPFTLDGTCTEYAQYRVNGVILSENPSSPVLRLTFDTVEGRLSCNLNSSISSIPSGEQAKDLAGSSFTVDMVPDSLDLTQISGSQWPDMLYQDQFDGAHEPMDDYDITTKTTASWVLSYQK